MQTTTMKKTEVVGEKHSKIPTNKPLKIQIKKLAADVTSSSNRKLNDAVDDSTAKVNAQPKGKLEDQLNFEHLQALEKIFRRAEHVSEGRLNLEEFENAMKQLLGPNISKRELEILFMKVDTDCDGAVDWDEYLSYMLLEYQGKAKMSNLAKEVPFPNPPRELPSNHKDVIVRIAFLQNLMNRVGSRALDQDNSGGRYLVLSKDGILGIYSSDFDLLKTLNVNHSRESSLGLWVTDVAACANVGLVAISSTEREISFYDVSGARLERKYQIVSFKDPVMTLNYWFNHLNLNSCTLVASDSSGTVIVFRFTKALKKGLFGNSLHKGLTRKVTVFALASQQVDGAHCLVYQLAQGLECFISCSACDNESMYLGDLTNIVYKPSWPGFVKRSNNRGCYYKVKRGIITLDYSKQWNLIVTGSFDGVIRTWHPGSSKPVTSVKTHHCSVPHVIFIDEACQFIACGNDRLIKVLEVRDNTVVQVLQPRLFTSMGPSSHQISALYYHKRSKALVLGTMQVVVLEGTESQLSDITAAKTHNGSVSVVLYNKLFDQVITSGHDSVVSVWDFNTGSKLIQFTVLEYVEVTAMTFDQTERRLVVGSRNGAISIWNFNNGACLKILTNGDGLEITGIICHKQKIIASGWERKMNVFIDSRNEAEELNKIESLKWREDHKEDVLSLTMYQHPGGESIIATCSYDGNIFIWSLESGSVICCLNKQTSFSPLTINGITFDQKTESKKYSNKKENRGRRGGVYDPASPKKSQKIIENTSQNVVDYPLIIEPEKLSENESSDIGCTIETLVSDSNMDSGESDLQSLSSDISHSPCQHHNQSPAPVPTITLDTFDEGRASISTLQVTLPEDVEKKLSKCNLCLSKQKKRKRRRKKKRSPSPKQSEKMEKLVQRIVSPLSCSRNHSISPDMDKVKKSSSQTNLLPSAGCIQPPKLKMLSSNAVPGGSSSANKSNLHQTEVNNVETKLPTSKAKSQYWKAEVCVTQVLFLQTRPHSPNTATLVAAGGMGWVYSWSVHPQGGLLGQFVGAHSNGEVVLSLATDTSNTYLFTGDSTGYVKIWKIENYCNTDINKVNTICDLTEIQLKMNLLTEEEMRLLSSRRASKLRTVPPNIKIYFRAHTNSISSISVVDEKETFVTACVDGTVRLWTFSGTYIGTFGQKVLWNSVLPKEGPRMPTDIRRIASANTLRLLNAGFSMWDRAKELVKLALSTMNYDIESPRNQILFNETIDIEEEYQRISKTLSRSKILGHSYKPTRRHRNLPKVHFKSRLKNVII